MSERLLERFGPFLIVRSIGRGGMGEVFIARTGRAEAPIAAVKRLRPDVARVPTFHERFQHEAALAVRLAHPNLVRTLDVGKVGDALYVASELVFGKDAGHIADRLREQGLGAPGPVVVRLLLDMLTALHYVHGAREDDGRWLKLVHRDVTPGNVLLGYDGVARLADFGLAKSLLSENQELTGYGEILGTPHYLAPEVIRGGRATTSSDLYGLAAVMYRVLTGVAPFQGTSAEVLFRALSERPRPLSELRPDLPAWFIELLHSMLDADPARRPRDAEQVRAMLERRAKAEGFAIGPSSVGRWLSQLFEAERGEELAERDEILTFDPIRDARPEGTVVLAQGRRDTALSEPKPSEESAPSDDAIGAPTQAISVDRPPPRRSSSRLTDSSLEAPAELDDQLPGFVDAPDEPSGPEEQKTALAERSTSIGAGESDPGLGADGTPTPAEPPRPEPRPEPILPPVRETEEMPRPRARPGRRIRWPVATALAIGLGVVAGLGVTGLRHALTRVEVVPSPGSAALRLRALEAKIRARGETPAAAILWQEWARAALLVVEDPDAAEPALSALEAKLR